VHKRWNDTILLNFVLEVTLSTMRAEVVTFPLFFSAIRAEREVGFAWFSLFCFRFNGITKNFGDIYWQCSHIRSCIKTTAVRPLGKRHVSLCEPYSLRDRRHWYFSELCLLYIDIFIFVKPLTIDDYLVLLVTFEKRLIGKERNVILYRKYFMLFKYRVLEI
jgi:hypothetical protein